LNALGQDSAAAETPTSAWRRLPPNLASLVGFAALAIPTLISLGKQTWSLESGAHGPIILAAGLWLLWRKRAELEAQGQAGHPLITAALLLSSLAVYVAGRAFDFITLEVAGLYGVGLAILHANFGLRALSRQLFPLLFLALVIPPPASVLTALTAPLKVFVSTAAANILHAAGLPIARQGVVIMVGPYQLLVEDACSGMNSIIGLIAISLLYIYLMHGSRLLYWIFLASMAIPIAIVANIMRIMVLVLLTYFFGDAVGQGFAHMAAGIFLFGVALCMVFGCDQLMSRLLKFQTA
jgi:exosortase